MHEALSFGVAVAAGCLGFACLALSLQKHWEEVTGERTLPPGRVTALRTVGYSLLVGTLALTVLVEGPGFGGVLWIFVLSAGAAVVTFTLAWRPSWLRLAVRAARRAR